MFVIQNKIMITMMVKVILVCSGFGHVISHIRFANMQGLVFKFIFVVDLVPQML